MDGIANLRAENALLIEKAIDAPEGNYIQGEDADDHIENLTNINDKMIQEVTEIGKLVVGAVEKAKNDQMQHRRKYREEVMKKSQEDIDITDPELLLKIQEKKKLYFEVSKLRREIQNYKLKLKSFGTTERIVKEK